MTTPFSNKHRLTFTILGVLLIFFLTWPILRTLTSNSLAILWETLLDAEVRGAILLTFSSSAIATIIALLLGVPLAYLLARSTFPGKRLVEGLIDLPIVIPHSAAGIALLMVFGRRSLLGKMFGGG